MSVSLFPHKTYKVSYRVGSKIVKDKLHFLGFVPETTLALFEHPRPFLNNVVASAKLIARTSVDNAKRENRMGDDTIFEYTYRSKVVETLAIPSKLISEAKEVV